MVKTFDVSSELSLFCTNCFTLMIIRVCFPQSVVCSTGTVFHDWQAEHIEDTAFPPSGEREVTSSDWLRDSGSEMEVVFTGAKPTPAAHSLRTAETYLQELVGFPEICFNH